MRRARSPPLPFFFNDTATTEIYTLSLHDALPISPSNRTTPGICCPSPTSTAPWSAAPRSRRSEEHTSELQSRLHLVCRLLLEKKNQRSGQGIRGAALARQLGRPDPLSRGARRLGASRDHALRLLAVRRPHRRVAESQIGRAHV